MCTGAATTGTAAAAAVTTTSNNVASTSAAQAVTTTQAQGVQSTGQGFIQAAGTTVQVITENEGGRVRGGDALVWGLLVVGVMVGLGSV